MASVDAPPPAAAGAIAARLMLPAGGPDNRLNAGAGEGAAAKNVPVQCLRGLAALFVMLYHTGVYAQQMLGEPGWAAAFDSRFGLVGVAIFFAVSGALMASLIHRTDPWQFLAHRIVRIYPTYLLAAAIVAPVIALAGGVKPVFHGLSLLLVPLGQRPYYLAVEWTLVFECTYYVALFLIAVAGWQRHLNRIALGWLCALFAAPFLTGWGDPIFVRLDFLWLVPANVAFAAGLLVPWIGRNVRIRSGMGVLAVGLLLALRPDDPAFARLVAGIAAALLVLDVARFKVSARATLGLYTLGDWSYALYLVHVPCILLTYKFWPKGAGVGAASVAAIAAALVMAAALGSLDLRLYRYLKSAVHGLGDKERRRRVNVYALVFIAASLAGVFVLK